jgi:hypothetical protein
MDSCASYSALVPDFDAPTDYPAFKASVLSALEDDSVGVYELWWEANGRYPDWPVSKRLAVAEYLASDLLSEGAEMFEGPWIGPDHERSRIEDSAAALRDWACWVPQDNRATWLLVPKSN